MTLVILNISATDYFRYYNLIMVLMKKSFFVLMGMLLCSCGTMRVVDSWKNNDAATFNLQKILVIGVTDNLTARKIFESKLKSEFQNRNIQAVESTAIFDTSFTNTKQTEAEIQTMISGISEKGFDSVIISVVKGVDNRRNYSQGYYTVGYNWRRFGRYYYKYQDIYYTPGYYSKYSVYHIETSLYNINEKSDKSLLWVGAIDLDNPQYISRTVNEYVRVVMKQLEKEKIVVKSLINRQ